MESFAELPAVEADDRLDRDDEVYSLDLDLLLDLELLECDERLDLCDFRFSCRSRLRLRLFFLYLFLSLDLERVRFFLASGDLEECLYRLSDLFLFDFFNSFLELREPREVESDDEDLPILILDFSTVK